MSTRERTTGAGESAGRIAVAVPTWQEASNMARITQLVDRAVQEQAHPERFTIVNLDNGSTDGTPRLFSQIMTRSPKIAYSTAPLRGKGHNLRRLLVALCEGDFDVAITVDADLRAVPADWFPALLDACDDDGPILAVPLYPRAVNDGNLTDHVVAPLVLAATGYAVRQPIGGDMGFNRAFGELALSSDWPEHAGRFGVDIFLVLLALQNDAVHQVPLAVGKHHAWRRSRPADVHDEFAPKFGEVVATLLDQITGPAWRDHEVTDLPRFPKAPALEQSIARRHNPTVMRRVAASALERSRTNPILAELVVARILVPDTYIDDGTWAAVLCGVVRRWGGGYDRRAVLDAFLTLLYCRIVTAQSAWVRETPAERDEHLFDVATEVRREFDTLRSGGSYGTHPQERP